MIPQSNPLAGYVAHKQAVDAAVSRVLDSGWYILGQEVAAFEREFSAWTGVNHAVGVANGTDAIELALRAIGVVAGDKVATVSHTAVATVSAIRRLGAIPMFVDIEADYFTMDASSLEDVISNAQIKAIVVVHLYGQMADMPAILEVAERHGLPVIEDCAQAHGATLGGRKAGTWGDLGCFSFYPTKNLGCYGDGGAVVTPDAALADRLYALRQYGWDKSRCSQIEGVNSRLDELQAAILRARLVCLDEDNAARQRIADQYRRGLQACGGVTLPVVREGCEHVYHQFVICCANRDTVKLALEQAGVGCAVHYLHAAHCHAAYSGGAFAPVGLQATENAVSRILSLPMFPELDANDVDRVVNSIRAILDS